MASKVNERYTFAGHEIAEDGMTLHEDSWMFRRSVFGLGFVDEIR